MTWLWRLFAERRRKRMMPRVFKQMSPAQREEVFDLFRKLNAHFEEHWR